MTSCVPNTPLRLSLLHERMMRGEALHKCLPFTKVDKNPDSAYHAGVEFKRLQAYIVHDPRLKLAEIVFLTFVDGEQQETTLPGLTDVSRIVVNEKEIFKVLQKAAEHQLNSNLSISSAVPQP